MLGPLTYMDVGLIGLCVVSGLLAMARGFTRELLSLSSWALALVATAWVVLSQEAMAEQLAEQFFKSVPLAKGVMGLIVFIVVLLLVHFITVRFSDRILESGIGLIDRILGFFFGVARGFLLVAILYAFYAQFFQESDRMAWVNEAQTRPYVEQTADGLMAFIQGVLPDDLSIPGLERQTGEQQEG